MTDTDHPSNNIVAKLIADANKQLESKETAVLEPPEQFSTLHPTTRRTLEKEMSLDAQSPDSGISEARYEFENLCLEQFRRERYANLPIEAPANADAKVRAGILCGVALWELRNLSHCTNTGCWCRSPNPHLLELMLAENAVGRARPANLYCARFMVAEDGPWKNSRVTLQFVKATGTSRWPRNGVEFG